MLATNIRHGDLCIDMRSDGSVQIVRQSDMTAVLLSLTEWNYLQVVMGLHGWPVVAPQELRQDVTE